MVESRGVVPERLPVVCFAFGEIHGMADTYITRLHEMLGRHCPSHFTLHCYSDRPRPALPKAIELRDCAGWHELLRADMRNTTHKLGLFNPCYVEFDAFLYLDLSVVIRRDMGPLLESAFARPEDLVIVPHWKNDGYNSSVMRIRGGGRLGAVYQAFVGGERYVQRVPGDQDFIRGVVHRYGLQAQVGQFPSGQIISFKTARQLGRRDAEAARDLFRHATIIKFHGQPKPHQALGMRYGLRTRWGELLHGNLRPVIPMRALRKAWTDAAAS